MKILTLFIAFAALAFDANAGAKVDVLDLDIVGQRVWKNECGGTVEGLTSWNSGENFASLGIGHFIWYPQGWRGPFEESFPLLIAVMKNQGVTVPAWCSGECPWPNRAAFLHDKDSPRMRDLRSFLAKTVRFQALFLYSRSHQAKAKIYLNAPSGEGERIAKQYDRLAATSAGAFALIDYVNFKGEGVLATERYNGEGWGLQQVLAGMHGSGSVSTREFADSAKAVLTRRVRNAPPGRHEERWLAGWKNRVESYAR